MDGCWEGTTPLASLTPLQRAVVNCDVDAVNALIKAGGKG
jgi:hypothetical protein